MTDSDSVNAPGRKDADPPISPNNDADALWSRLQELHGGEEEPSLPENRVRPAPDMTQVMTSAPESAPLHSQVTPSQARQYYVPAPETPNVVAGSVPIAPPSRTVSASSAPAQRGPAQPGPAQPGPTRSAPAQDRGRRSKAAPRTKSRRRKRWYRPKLRWLFLYFPLLILLAIGGTALWAWNTVNGLYRVDLGDALTAPADGATNYLIVGSDSREGVDPNDPNAGVIGKVAGRRSDTIIILRVKDGAASMMSIPRDLWVTNVKTGKKGRINATYNAGPQNLARSVTANLGIPINRYVEVDFVSFGAMVDAVGGIDISFPNPASDSHSGLKIDTAGVHRLNGSQALAYVRSRHYTEVINGVSSTDPTADLGRQQRQQNFIRTVLKTVGGTRNPITLLKVASSAASGVRVDSELGVGDLLSLARQLGSADPVSVVLPTSPANKGGAAVLVLREAEALPVLQQFGAPTS